MMEKALVGNPLCVFDLVDSVLDGTLVFHWYLRTTQKYGSNQRKTSMNGILTPGRSVPPLQLVESMGITWIQSSVTTHICGS